MRMRFAGHWSEKEERKDEHVQPKLAMRLAAELREVLTEMQTEQLLVSDGGRQQKLLAQQRVSAQHAHPETPQQLALPAAVSETAVRHGTKRKRVTRISDQELQRWDRSF